VTASAALLVALVVTHRAAPDPVVVLVFGGFGIVGENVALTLPSSLRISPTSMFILAAAAAFSHRSATFGAMVVGAMCPLVLAHLRRRRWAVMLFNSAQYALCGAAAALCYGWLDHVGAALMLRGLVTSLVFVALNVALVVPAAVVELGEPARRIFADVRVVIPNYVVLGLLGVLLGRLYADVSPVAALVVLVAALIARTAFLPLVKFRRMHAHLESLYGFTSELEGARDEGATIGAVLGEARHRLGADDAELSLGRGPGGDRRISLGADAACPDTIELAEPGDELGVSAGGPVLIVGSGADDERDALLARGGWDTAMIAPLRVGGEVVGALLVGRRHPAATRFAPDDLRMFEMLANHAAVALENCWLLDRLRWDADHDALTGLLNRSRFHEIIEEAVRRPRPAAVMLVDLDHFKEINDTLGHDEGDRLIQEVARRLNAHVGWRGTVARLGGDEFGVLLPGTSADGAARACDALHRAVGQPVRAGGLNIELTASVGVARSPVDGTDPTVLLQHAEAAMYAAKRAHGGWQVYAPEPDRYGSRRLALAGEMRDAIASGQMEVLYQPKADMRTGVVRGAEALLRWRHPRLGLLGPSEFIPIAEHAGLIHSLTMLVLRRAVLACRDLNDRGFPFEVAVNLSVGTVLDADLPDQISEVLRQAEVEAHCLTIEITESSVMVDPARTVAVLARLSALGISIAIDDFGTGYSSLSHLKQLPVDEIKVDQSFVSGMMVDDDDDVIVRSTIDLARNLGLRVVAEGVEDRRTWMRLADLGCDLAQGFFFSRPVPAERLPWIVERSQVSTHPLP